MPTEEIRKFWEQTRAGLDEVELNASVEPVEQSDAFTVEGRIKTRTINQVRMSSYEGRTIRAWYTVPSGQPPRHRPNNELIRHIWEDMCRVYLLYAPPAGIRVAI